MTTSIIPPSHRKPPFYVGDHVIAYNGNEPLAITTVGEIVSGTIHTYTGSYNLEGVHLSKHNERIVLATPTLIDDFFQIRDVNKFITFLKLPGVASKLTKNDIHALKDIQKRIGQEPSEKVLDVFNKTNDSIH